MIGHSMTCSNGHFNIRAPTNDLSPVLMMYPGRGSNLKNNANVATLLQDTLKEQLGDRFHCQECDSTILTSPLHSFTRLGDLLAINVVWPAKQPDSSRANAMALAVQPFRLLTEVDLTSLVSSLDQTQQFSASLSGIVSYSGSRIGRGHYTASVPYEEMWWSISDTSHRNERAQ